VITLRNYFRKVAQNKCGIKQEAGGTSAQMKDRSIALFAEKIQKG
jgi:hypothetical protein